VFFPFFPPFSPSSLQTDGSCGAIFLPFFSPRSPWASTPTKETGALFLPFSCGKLRVWVHFPSSSSPLSFYFHGVGSKVGLFLFSFFFFHLGIVYMSTMLLHSSLLSPVPLSENPLRGTALATDKVTGPLFLFPYPIPKDQAPTFLTRGSPSSPKRKTEKQNFLPSSSSLRWERGGENFFSFSPPLTPFF